MMGDYSSQVRLIDGRAEVRVGSRSFTVARRDGAGGAHNCPIELLVGALGS